MRWATSLILLMGFVVPVSAHKPDWKNMPTLPRIDVIGPLGARLPISHRRKYNRPTYWGGRIAYMIAPSSQEAMAWHDNVHRGTYKNHRPRIEKHFFYPKPWESMKIGARVPTVPENKADMYAPPETNVMSDDVDGYSELEPLEATETPTLSEPMPELSVEPSQPEPLPIPENGPRE